MSQHDFVIANQGFPAFRSDLNGALEAAVTLSSGSSAPTSTFAYQLWVDTASSPSVLKMRDGTNTAWITIGNIDSSADTFTIVGNGALFADGSAASPAVSFSSDTDTGLYRVGTNQIGLSAGGSSVLRSSATAMILGSTGTTLDITHYGGAVFNEDGADKDFRVEGDTDANLIFVDASTDRVGIGTSTPGTKLHVNVSSGASVARFTNGTTTTEVGTASTNVAYFGTTSNHSARIIQNNVTCLEVASGVVKIDNGYGSLQTIYGCRAWVNFDGTSGSIGSGRASGNVSSVIDNGTGLYTVNFTNAMPDANYATLVSASGGGAGYNNATSGLFSLGSAGGSGTYSASAVQIWFSLLTNAASGNDREIVNVAVFR